MRFAVVSDIHANWQAWNATLLDIRSLGADAILCLGDIVGYGPQPAEVLESVHAHADYIVLGNHDAVIAGKLDPDLFHDTARAVIEWTRRQLGDNAIKFLRQMPLSIDAGGFRCTHGDFSRPAAFNYILEPGDALASWQTVSHPLLFCGHTHEPGIFILDADRSMRREAPADFVLRPECRYLVNVGSVGQPRDAEARAGYALYDTDARAVTWRRIPFDLDAYRQALQVAGVSESASPFLAYDPRAGIAPIRERMNFSPATSPRQSVQNAVEVQEVRALRRQAQRWKRLTAAALCIALFGGGALGGAWWRHSRRALHLAAPPAPEWQARVRTPQPDANLLPPLASSAGRAPITGWTVRLGDRRAQTFFTRTATEDGETEENGDELRLILESETRRDPIALSSPPVPVHPGMRLQVLGAFRMEPDFDGHIGLVVSLERESEDGPPAVVPFLTVPPALKRRDRWLAAQRTFDVPARTRSVTIHVQGRFTGRVACRDLALRVR
jgi:diadenosine tetraphosphatase ApaH/serine/threonine PP2A family protein phosphatase